VRTLLAFACVAALAGCAPTAAEFPGGAIADYQLGGAYEPDAEVGIVARDSTEQPAEGVYSICYVNGFQTQPGAEWPPELLVSVNGDPLTDPNWPDEYIIDISTESSRADAAAVQFTSIERCAAAGFDAVEFDNLDSYSRSEGHLTLGNAVEFATLLVEHAHHLGLAAGQKNTGELGTTGRDEIGFDFAIVEECDQFEECDAFTEIYGDRVIDIEYVDDLRRPFAQLCADASAPASTLLRDRQLSPRGADDYVYEHC
jgi:hypothetical protein